MASPFITINEPTVKLAGKKLSLSFTPATQDDADIIKSYLPEPDAQTGEIDPEQIPDTLPGYLINLKAEFAIDNVVVASEAAGSMGTELYETLGYWDPRFGWDLSKNKPTAGEYQAIGLDLQGSSPEYAAKLQADLEATKTKLESTDEAQLADLTKQDLVGDMLESAIFSYFSMNNLQDDITAQQAGIVNYRAPSYGKFSTSLTTSYWFGTPRNVSSSGLVMDVDRVFNNKVDKDNDHQNRINFNRMTGNRLSAMEHLIPEQIFSTPAAPVEGISAVKAIALASAAGQKIWTITQDSLDVALAAINLHADSENEIRNAVNAGKIVTAHDQSINFNGWVGEGYIIIDPITGAGAYKIAGGGNGGFLSAVYEVLIFLAVFVAGARYKLASSLDFIRNAAEILPKCSKNYGGLAVGLAIFGLISIMLTIALGWLWVAALTTTASKIVASVLFALITTIELFALSVSCNKRR